MHLPSFRLVVLVCPTPKSHVNGSRAGERRNWRRLSDQDKMEKKKKEVFQNTSFLNFIFYVLIINLRFFESYFLSSKGETVSYNWFPSSSLLSSNHEDVPPFAIDSAYILIWFHSLFSLHWLYLKFWLFWDDPEGLFNSWTQLQISFH